MMATLRLVLALLGGALAAGGAGWAWNTFVDNPAIERAATRRAEDACAIRVADAAQRAEAAERERQKKISADALAAWQKAVDAQVVSRRAAEQNLDREIADYELKLRAANRSCLFTDDDFDWLRHEPGPAAGAGLR